jgi:hypothetical protein
MADERLSAGRGEEPHEGTGIDGRQLIGYALTIVCLIAVALVVSLGVQYVLRNRPAVTPTASGLQPASSTPRLQAAGAEDLKVFEAGKRELLDSYAWIDRDAGVVRIPIERAMSLLAQRSEAPAAAAKQASQ